MSPSREYMNLKWLAEGESDLSVIADLLEETADELRQKYHQGWSTRSVNNGEFTMEPPDDDV